MRRCPSCGSIFDDGYGRCPNCGYDMSNEIEGEAVEKESKVIGPEGASSNFNENFFDKKNDEHDPISNLEDFVFKDLPWFVELIFVILAFMNVFLGFVIAIILLTRPYPKYKSFGLVLLLICVVIFIVNLFFGMVSGIMGLVLHGLTRIIG